mmetsp:Transcript_12262/g.20573  ORF Transcript_12262/g.20573 Transcript_12262/m.20573 type:complete len:250 (-) Transcript_12262:60-809(-)
MMQQHQCFDGLIKFGKRVCRHHTNVDWNIVHRHYAGTVANSDTLARRLPRHMTQRVLADLRLEQRLFQGLAHRPYRQRSCAIHRCKHTRLYWRPLNIVDGIGTIDFGQWTCVFDVPQRDAPVERARDKHTRRNAACCVGRRVRVQCQTGDRTAVCCVAHVDAASCTVPIALKHDAFFAAHQKRVDFGVSEAQHRARHWCHTARLCAARRTARRAERRARAARDRCHRTAFHRRAKLIARLVTSANAVVR